MNTRAVTLLLLGLFAHCAHSQETQTAGDGRR
jgi:hypothetical protein